MKRANRILLTPLRLVLRKIARDDLHNATNYHEFHSDRVKLLMASKRELQQKLKTAKGRKNILRLVEQLSQVRQQLTYSRNEIIQLKKAKKRYEERIKRFS